MLAGNNLDFDFPSKTALVADDEDSVRSLLKRILWRQGFVVQEARTGSEAIALLNQDALNCGFQLLVSDIQMPDLDGVALAERFLAACPRSGVVLISGFSFDTIDIKSEGHRWMFVAKPFLPNALIAAIETVLKPAANRQDV